MPSNEPPFLSLVPPPSATDAEPAAYSSTEGMALRSAGWRLTTPADLAVMIARREQLMVTGAIIDGQLTTWVMGVQEMLARAQELLSSSPPASNTSSRASTLEPASRTAGPKGASSQRQGQKPCLRLVSQT